MTSCIKLLFLVFNSSHSCGRSFTNQNSHDSIVNLQGNIDLRISVNSTLKDRFEDWLLKASVIV